MAWSRPLVLLLLYMASSYCLYRESKIVFENNGFSNILLAIHDSVKNESIVDVIKDVFTNASTVLHKATNKRAYFKEIIILIPNSWNDIPGITPAAAGQTLQYADIVISGPRPTHRNFPFTRSYAGCGQHGIHMQMTSDVFLNQYLPPVKSYPGKFIVHEWGTFRWGVFNEYPSDGENEFYYSTLYGRPDPIRCTVGLLGRIMARFPNNTQAVCNPNSPLFQDSVTGLMNPYCKFYMYPYHHRGFESMMDHQWAKEITAFCDDTVDYQHNKYGHNFEAPNLQNRLCGHRSTMSVILETDDFRNGKNQPRDVSDLTPTFRIVKAARTKRATLYVEDDSLKANQLADRILACLHPTVHVDILHSNNKMGKRLAFRTGKVHNRKGRIRTKRNLNPKNILLRKGDSEAGIGDHLIVIRNEVGGDEANLTFLNHSAVHIFGVNRNVTTLRRTIFEVTHLVNDGKGPIYLYYKSVTLKKGETFHDTIVIDEFLYGRVYAHVCYQNEVSPNIVLTSPSGNTVHHFFNDQHIRCTAAAFEPFTIGRWTMEITNKHDLPEEIFVSVLSHPTDSMSGIKISAKASHRVYQGQDRLLVFAEVIQGHHPLLGLEVVAEAKDDDGQIVETSLLDNGSGADLHKDDGIYSRYLPYHRNLNNVPLLVVARGHHMKARVVNTSVSYDRDEYDEILAKPVTVSTHLQHGLNRVTEITVPFTAKQDMGTNTADFIPPARVHDLKSHDMDSQKVITLTFTAVGDDLDHGTVEYYRIMYAVTSKEILDNRHNLTNLSRVQQTELLEGDLNRPLSSGFMETFKINSTMLSITGHGCAFVVVAVDKNGNCGDMSNIVTAGLVRN